MRLADNQPDNICHDCGVLWGNEKPKHHQCRTWIDTCDVCKQLRAIVDVSEWGYLKQGWDKKDE